MATKSIEDDFERMVPFAWLGAKGYRQFDAVKGVDMFAIVFSNGVSFTDEDPRQLWQEAAAYRQITKKLTGESP